jgi:hypothetical protein
LIQLIFSASSDSHSSGSLVKLVSKLEADARALEAEKNTILCTYTSDVDGNLSVTSCYVTDVPSGLKGVWWEDPRNQRQGACARCDFESVCNGPSGSTPDEYPEHEIVYNGCSILELVCGVRC